MRKISRKAIVLCCVIILTLTASCGGDVPKTLPSGVDFSPPDNVVNHDDGKITLDGLAAPMHMTVDLSGVIYVDDRDSVYRIDDDNKPSVLINGLTRCAGVTAVDETLYVFDVRNELYMLTYDLQGNKKNERVIPIENAPKEVWSCFAFQTIPVIFIEYNFNQITPLLYNWETGKTIQMSIADDYSLTPMEDGRLIGKPITSIGGAVILTVDASGEFTVTPAGRAYENNNYTHFFHDLEMSQDYVLATDRRILRMDDDDEAYAASLQCDSGYSPFALRFRNQTLYALMMGNGGDTIIATARVIYLDPSERRELRIMTTITVNEDRDIFISYFQRRHPEIELILIDCTWRDEETRLQLISGELEVDIIYAEPWYYYAGIYRDLAEFPAIAQALGNPNLLDGVRSKLTDPKGVTFGVPISASYAGYLINTELFKKWKLTPPSADWTVDDYYGLAMQVADLNKEKKANIYLTEKFKDEYVKARVLYQPNYMAFGSDNEGFIPRFDTPEMVRYLKRGLEVYELFPYIFEYLSDGNTQQGYPDNHLLWEVSMIPRERDKYTPPEGMWLTEPPIPWPLDIYGNGGFRFGDCWGIYTRAKNTAEAELFVAEYLDEVYQYDNAKGIVLYTDFSRYMQIDIPKNHQDFIVSETKSDLSYMGFIVGVSVHDAIILYYDLDDRYYNGEITAEELAKTYQTEIEKRIQG